MKEGKCTACGQGTFKDFVGDYASECTTCEGCSPGFVRSNCGGSDPGVCEACPAGKYEKNGKCVECAVCGVGFERQSCGGPSEGKCVACGEGTFKSTKSNERCLPFEPCSPGQALRNFDATKKGECKPCAKGTFKDIVGVFDASCVECAGCEPGYVRLGCGGISPGSCVECDGDMFEQNGKCVTLSVCSESQYELSEPTKSSDRVCQDITDCTALFSPYGGFAETSFTYNSDNVCRQLSVCAENGEYESRAPSKTQDRVCSACESCDAGFARINAARHRKGNAPNARRNL